MNATATLPGERYYYRFETAEDEPSELDPVDVDPPATLDNYEEPPKGDPSFWKRQFGDCITAKQRKFDWLMGVWLPMVCFYFDPGVFTGWVENTGPTGLLGAYQVPAYALAFAAIMAQAAWLLWGKDLGPAGLLVGMVLSLSAVVAAIIGVILFPFSLIGLLFLLGLLGFTPLFSAFVYWRTAVRAIRSGSSI